jgi:hypothetical protein
LDDVANAYGNLSKAADYGIDSYGSLSAQRKGLAFMLIMSLNKDWGAL